MSDFLNELTSLKKASERKKNQKKDEKRMEIIRKEMKKPVTIKRRFKTNIIYSSFIDYVKCECKKSAKKEHQSRKFNITYMGGYPHLVVTVLKENDDFKDLYVNRGCERKDRDSWLTYYLEIIFIKDFRV